MSIIKESLARIQELGFKASLEGLSPNVEDHELYQEYMEQNVLLVSHFPNGVTPYHKAFELGWQNGQKHKAGEQK